MIRWAFVHQQLLEPFELEATFPRPLIRLEARYNFVPEIDLGHGGPPTAHNASERSDVVAWVPGFQVDGLCLGSRSLTRSKLAGALSLPDRVMAEFLSRLSRGASGRKQRVINIFLERVRGWRDKRDK